MVRVVLVSDPYHSERIDAIAHEVGLDAVTSPTRTSPIKGVAAFKRMFGETLRVAAGRVVRIRTTRPPSLRSRSSFRDSLHSDARLGDLWTPASAPASRRTHSGVV